MVLVYGLYTHTHRKEMLLSSSPPFFPLFSFEAVLRPRLGARLTAHYTLSDPLPTRSADHRREKLSLSLLFLQDFPPSPQRWEYVKQIRKRLFFIRLSGSKKDV